MLLSMAANRAASSSQPKKNKKKTQKIIQMKPDWHGNSSFKQIELFYPNKCKLHAQIKQLRPMITQISINYRTVAF